MLSSILSFGQNPLYTASNYTKMSLKNSQVVKDLEVVNALMLTSPYIHGNVRVIFYATQAGCTGKTHTSQPRLGGKIQN